MIYQCIAFATLIGAAEAFNVGAVAARSSRAAVSMQVTEAEVASPVALAKVRAQRARAQCLHFFRRRSRA